MEVRAGSLRRGCLTTEKGRRMRIEAEFPFGVIEEADVGIVMPDGCRLSARIWRAEGAGRVPAVLEYIPYRKRDGTAVRDALMHPWMAGQGYAVLRVDMRGNGESDGLMADEYTPQELSDAVAVIDWIAAQDWCSGAVGMMGKSWGGFNCLQVAALQPPALKAVVTVCSTTDRFADDVHFKGGCLLGENLGWGAVMLSFSSRPPDPALRDDWREVWLSRLAAEPFLAPVWAREQARGDYWRHGSVCEDYAALKAKVLSFGGWADGYMNTPAALVSNVPGAKGIVGPWVHQYPHMAVPGPAVGFLQLAKRWWDRWLKGERNGAEDDPAYRVWMMDSAPPDASAPARAGVWVAERALPSDRVERREMPLGAGGRLGGSGAVQARIATPQHMGMMAGEYFPMGPNAEMPGDQRGEDALSVCFDGEVLAAPLALLGAARLRLTLASDRPLAFVAARLCDVAPDGASVRIAHGVLNLCHAAERAHPARLEPGRVMEVAFDLDQMACRLAPGHRLRLALSNAYWPLIWPGPEAAVLTLTGGSLSLPVHAGPGADEWTPPEPVASPPLKQSQIEPGRAARRIERDLISGTVVLVVEDHGALVENEEHGLITQETMTERWTIHPDDPATAHVRIDWQQRLAREREGWVVRTEGFAEMWGEGEDLVMAGQVVAHEGGAEISRRDWRETVPRRFV